VFSKRDGGNEGSVVEVVNVIGFVAVVDVERASLKSGEEGREEGGEPESVVVFWNWRSSACRS